MITYNDILDDVNYLSRYGVETGAVGASGYGRMIPYVKLGGESEHTVLVTAGMHAREHVSSLFVVRQMYKLYETPLPCNVIFVPMTNPDGNVLISDGADAFGFDRDRLIALNGGNTDFSLWKANAAGVDLNTNFDARWGEGVQNVRMPGSADYIGASPFSESETVALASFTRKVRPVLTVSYHARGQEIYYLFGQTGQALQRDTEIAKKAAEITGYDLIHDTRGSAGGYKDWCISALGVPSLTVELVSDSLAHPLPDACIKEDFARGALLPIELYNFMREKGYV